MSTKNTPEVPAAAELATDDQVDHIKNLASKQIRALTRDQAQAIIMNGGVYQNALDKMIGDVLEQLTNTVTRHVKVNRSRMPQVVLDATGRRQYKNDAIVATMPRGEGDDGEIVFFKLGRWVSDADLAAEYEQRGLVPDQFGQAQVNIDDPAFADEHPNGTHWKLADGGWGFMAFNRWDGGRNVDVDRGGGGWSGHCWFGGRRKF